MASFMAGGVAPVVAMERTQHLSGAFDFGGPIDTLPRRNVVYGNSEGDLGANATGTTTTAPPAPPPGPAGTVTPPQAAPVTSASGPGPANAQFNADGTPTGTTPGANPNQPSSMLPSTGLRNPNDINAAGGSSNLTGPVQTIGYDPVAHAAALKAGVSYAYSGGGNQMNLPGWMDAAASQAYQDAHPVDYSRSDVNDIKSGREPM